jgi:hypothetical protein
MVSYRIQASSPIIQEKGKHKEGSAHAFGEIIACNIAFEKKWDKLRIPDE